MKYLTIEEFRTFIESLQLSSKTAGPLLRFNGRIYVYGRGHVDVFREYEVTSVEDIGKIPLNVFLHQKLFGRKALYELTEVLKEMGIVLGGYELKEAEKKTAVRKQFLEHELYFVQLQLDYLAKKKRSLERKHNHISSKLAKLKIST